MDNLVGTCPQLYCAEFDNLGGPTIQMRQRAGPYQVIHVYKSVSAS